jgi:signal transduction histidine kinase
VTPSPPAELQTDDAQSDTLREALLATSRAILSKQQRYEQDLASARETLRRQNDELKRVNSILETTLDATPVGVLVAGLDQRVMLANRRFTELWPAPDDARAATLPLLTSALRRWVRGPESLASWHTAVMQAPDEVHRMRWHTSTDRELACTAVPQRSGGECVGVVFNWTDVTEEAATARLRAAAEADRLANVAKSAFMSRASHELRTPLNAVVGFAQLLESTPAVVEDPSLVQQVGLILSAGNHLTTLVEDLLHLSNIESGQLTLSEAPVDLNAVVYETLKLLEAAAAARGIVLRQKAVADAWVLADRTRLRQVLINLASNAVKYNRPDGRVELVVMRSGAHWCVQIVDTGQGLTPQQVSHLFEPFNRLGAERGTVEGTGLGLSIARQLVLAMKGRIDVQSTPGVGSVFSVSLPATAAVPPG